MKVLKYLFAIFFIMSAIGALFTGSMIAGLLLAVLGIILLPPVSEILAKKLKFWNSKIARYGLYAVIFILVGATMKTPPKAALNGTIHTTIANETTVINKPQQEQSTSEDTKMDNSEFWKKYDPIVKERIYKLIKEKDCQGLQEEFNVTADNMDRIQERNGDGSRNLELMTFLEGQMQDLECH